MPYEKIDDNTVKKVESTESVLKLDQLVAYRDGLQKKIDGVNAIIIEMGKVGVVTPEGVV